MSLAIERPHRLPLPAEDLELPEEHCCRVDGKGCVPVWTHWYSTPLLPGTQVRVRVAATTVTVWHADQEVACPVARGYRRRQSVLNLEHYWDGWARQPGALAGSTPLAHWRATGQGTVAHDPLEALHRERPGSQEGTQPRIELLPLGRQHGSERLTRAIQQALLRGAHAAATVRYFLTAPMLIASPGPAKPSWRPACA